MLLSGLSGDLNKVRFLLFYSRATVEYVTVVGVEVLNFKTQDVIPHTRSGPRGVITIATSALNFFSLQRISSRSEIFENCNEQTEIKVVVEQK